MRARAAVPLSYTDMAVAYPDLFVSRDAARMALTRENPEQMPIEKYLISLAPGSFRSSWAGRIITLRVPHRAHHRLWRSRSRLGLPRIEPAPGEQGNPRRPLGANPQQDIQTRIWPRLPPRASISATSPKSHRARHRAQRADQRRSARGAPGRGRICRPLRPGLVLVGQTPR